MSAKEFGYKEGETVRVTGGVWMGEEGIVTGHDVPGLSIPVKFERFPGTEYFDIGPLQLERVGGDPAPAELPTEQMSAELTKAARVIIAALALDTAKLTTATQIVDSPLAQLVAPILLESQPEGKRIEQRELDGMVEGIKLTIFYAAQLRELFERLEKP